MTHVVGYIIWFKDGGPPEGQLLGTGTLEECQHIQKFIPAVAYSGSRPLDMATMTVVPREESPWVLVEDGAA